MANYAATTNAANVPLTQASDSYIPFAGLKFGLLRMTKLLKGGNGVRGKLTRCTTSRMEDNPFEATVRSIWSFMLTLNSLEALGHGPSIG